MEARDPTAQGFKDSREEKESLAICNGLTDVGKLGILEINNWGGHCIYDLVYSDTVWRDKTGGSVIQTLGQAVSQGRGQKYISGCQSYFLSGRGGFPEQAKISCLLTLPWKSHV